MPFSRRAMFASLAALPLTTTATASVTDSIFAAIERYRAACVAQEVASLEAHAAAEAEMLAAYDVLVATTPQTIAGAQALIELAVEDADAAGEGQCAGTLKVVRRALDRLAVA